MTEISLIVTLNNQFTSPHISGSEMPVVFGLSLKPKEFSLGR